MTIDIEDRAGIKLLRLEGELVGGEEGSFIEAITGLMEGRGLRFVVELAEVPFMNSAGLGDLVRVTAQINTLEGRLILANLSPFVEGVLQSTRLDRFFEVVSTVDEALRRLTEQIGD